MRIFGCRVYISTYRDPTKRKALNEFTFIAVERGLVIMYIWNIIVAILFKI
jgi:hypothetical protein